MNRYQKALAYLTLAGATLKDANALAARALEPQRSGLYAQQTFDANYGPSTATSLTTDNVQSIVDFKSKGSSSSYQSKTNLGWKHKNIVGYVPFNLSGESFSGDNSLGATSAGTDSVSTSTSGFGLGGGFISPSAALKIEGLLKNYGREVTRKDYDAILKRIFKKDDGKGYQINAQAAFDISLKDPTFAKWLNYLILNFDMSNVTGHSNTDVTLDIPVVGTITPPTLVKSYGRNEIGGGIRLGTMADLSLEASLRSISEGIPGSKDTELSQTAFGVRYSPALKGKSWLIPIRPELYLAIVNTSGTVGTSKVGTSAYLIGANASATIDQVKIIDDIVKGTIDNVVYDAKGIANLVGKIGSLFRKKPKVSGELNSGSETMKSANYNLEGKITPVTER